MRHSDVRISLVLFAVFAALLAYTFTLPKPQLSVGVGPAFVPQIVLSALLCLTVALLIKGWLQTRRSTPDPPEKRQGRLHIYGMLLAVGFVLLMEYVGTFVSIPLFIAAIMLLAGGRRPLTVVLMALGIPAIIYMVFTLFLQIQFPAEWAF